MLIELFGVRDTEAMRRAVAIRVRVFVEEQGVPLAEELDEHDESDAGAVHALAVVDGEAIGTGRYYPLDAERVQIGRMAVLPRGRGLGAGRSLLDALMAEAARRGFLRACLLAQVSASEFYRRAGFSAEPGEPARIWDAGILHQMMERELEPAPNISRPSGRNRSPFA
jgi:predicted GNAT family N-acyltransferase